MNWFRVAIVLLLSILGCFITTGWTAGSAGEIQIATNSVTGFVGEPVEIRVEGTTEQLPSGYMYSVVATTTAYPGQIPPAILTGIPDTTINCQDVGDYRIRLRVSLVNKSSCGGASAQTLLDEEVALHISGD